MKMGMPFKYGSDSSAAWARRSWLKSAILAVGGLFVRRPVCHLLAAEFPKQRAGMAKPIQLHIYIEIKAGKGPELETLYYSEYVPAIRGQKGFLWTRLLRHYGSDIRYEIDISFKSEQLRAKWAQSAEHQTAWPKIEAVSTKITWEGFDQLL